MKQKHITLILIILLLNISEKTWRDFPKYYKSLAYVSFMNCLYYYLCKRHLVWELTPSDGFRLRTLRGVYVFIVTPLAVLLCLSKFPNTVSKQVVHIVKWVLASSFIEYYLVKKRMIKFNHGWNIAWSGFVYLEMYVCSYLYIKKPLLTWLLSLCSIIFFMSKFKVPLTKRLLKGPLSIFFPKNSKLKFS